ncbi:MAG TPA: ATP synthase F0 subunit B [Anaerohalosphaeraceae bacterium]|jgi:F-type H+-transporting ATPase subunit b|nr:MAG: ATP synthase subunit b precursor [bacterium ADurb.Bin478]HPY77830.1 ATP synthase F0 subunit B [Anaerohalosphaeraceae bacterium]
MKTDRIIAILWIGLLLCGPAAGAQEGGDSAEKISIWGGYAGEAVWTLVWFAALLAALRLFAWKPLLSGLRSREEHIEKQISDAEKSKAAAQQTLEEYRAQLADADRQGREIITQRVKEAEEQARAIQVQNQKEIERIKQRMEADIEREQSVAEQQLWEQAGVIIQRLGGEIFKKTLDDADNQKLIEEAIARLREVEEKKP